MKSRHIVVGLLLLVSLTIPAAVLAKSVLQAGGPVDQQGFSWSRTEARTSSDEWEPLADLKAVPALCPGQGGASASVTLAVAPESAPFFIRVIMQDVDNRAETTVMQPGELPVDAGTGSPTGSSHSATFVSKRVPGEHGSVFRLQWRTASAETEAVVTKAVLRALWNDKAGLCR